MIFFPEKVNDLVAMERIGKNLDNQWVAAVAEMEVGRRRHDLIRFRAIGVGRTVVHFLIFL